MDPLSAGLSFGGGLAATAANIWMNERNNDRQEAFAREMYTNQRMDANYDWFRTNQYNSPAEQMNRLRQAGLNPNLVYGKGAETTAATLQTATPQKSNQQAPNIPGNNIVMDYARLRQTQQQTDNLDKQNALLTAETIGKNLDNVKKDVDNKRLKEIVDEQIAQAKLDTANKSQSYEIDRQRNIRETESNKAYLAKIAADTELSKQQLELLKNRTSEAEAKAILAQWESTLTKYGISQGTTSATNVLLNILRTLLKNK